MAGTIRCLIRAKKLNHNETVSINAIKIIGAKKGNNWKGKCLKIKKRDR